MKLDDLFERSAVIKKDGFAILQTALNNELPDNLYTNGVEACLLHSFSEAIRQQTGERLDRLSLVTELGKEHSMDKRWIGGTTRKHHDLNELIKHITTTGVLLKGSDERVKFNVKLYFPKKVDDVKKFIHEGISMILAWQNTDWSSDVYSTMEWNKFMNFFDKKDLENFETFKKKFKVFKENTTLYEEGFTDKDYYDVVRGIMPYKKKQRTVSSYHGVLLVGYDDKDDVFILKDIRDKYLMKGLCKIPYQYVADMLKGHSDFVKTVIGIEAEKIKD